MRENLAKSKLLSPSPALTCELENKRFLQLNTILWNILHYEGVKIMRQSQMPMSTHSQYKKKYIKMFSLLRQIAFLWVSCWFNGEFMPLGLKEDVVQYVFLSHRLC